jgi:hypothetical protein
MTAEVHDFYGPYQIHNTHDGHSLVFIKGISEAFDIDSERLAGIVESKITELNTELLKWNALRTAIGKDYA